MNLGPRREAVTEPNKLPFPVVVAASSGYGSSFSENEGQSFPCQMILQVSTSFAAFLVFASMQPCGYERRATSLYSSPSAQSDNLAGFAAFECRRKYFNCGELKESMRFQLPS